MFVPSFSQSGWGVSDVTISSPYWGFAVFLASLLYRNIFLSGVQAIPTFRWILIMNMLSISRKVSYVKYLSTVYMNWLSNLPGSGLAFGAMECHSCHISFQTYNMLITTIIVLPHIIVDKAGPNDIIFNDVNLYGS